MIHEHLQTDIVCEDCSSGLLLLLLAVKPHSCLALRDVGGAWIELGQEESRLRPAFVTVNVARNGEPESDDFLGHD